MGDGEGEAVASVLGVSVGEGSEAAAGVAAPRGVGDGTEDAVDEVLDGVTIVGKTEPFNMPPANSMNSKQAKMPPYSGESITPLQPLVMAAKLKRASPSPGAA